tara:strand:+ start:331 stop:537 length:207 start_codon:yes stop_codon:yes gene_type:complete
VRWVYGLSRSLAALKQKERVVVMTKLEFFALCNELTLDSNLVLDDDNVQAMLISRKDQELKEYLETQY